MGRGRLAAAAALVLLAGPSAGQEPPRLVDARARLQALIQGPDNRLAPFRPSIAGLENPWRVPRAIPLVRVAAPWGADDALWIQVPEHAWTQGPLEAEPTLLFSGRPREIASSHGWSLPHPPLAPPEWKARADGGIELDSALAGGLAVHFRVLPGDRLFEIRFGVTNASAAPLGTTWVQLCSAFGKMGALRDQGAETARLFADGAAIGWGDAGQDLGWLEAQRDPRSCRIEKSCYLEAHVRGHEAAARTAPDLMVLARAVDVPLIAKSDHEGQRHVVFYSPCAREVMYNALSPCCHADPVLDGVAPGETRWGVLYGLYFEGELGALLEALAEADRALRTTAGLVE